MLPASTEKVWSFLSTQPALAGFILVGGSALALRIGHRISEDLDFAFPAAQLPRRRLAVLADRARAAGLCFVPNDDEGALEEFIHGGMELQDYQQDYLVNDEVKVSFFVPDDPLIRVLLPPDVSRVRIAELDELFRSKCLLSARRSKTRDWYDLFTLFKKHGFTWRDYVEAFAKGGVPTQADLGFARLCDGIPQPDDEGYLNLLPNPPSLLELKEFFEILRATREVETAAERARTASEASSGPSELESN